MVVLVVVEDCPQPLLLAGVLKGEVRSLWQAALRPVGWPHESDPFVFGKLWMIEEVGPMGEPMGELKVYRTKMWLLDVQTRV